MEDGWFAYQSNTGEILFFYNKNTQEYRWLSCKCTSKLNDTANPHIKQEVLDSPQCCHATTPVTNTPPGLPPKKEFKTQGTQTDIVGDTSLCKTTTVNHHLKSSGPHIKQKPVPLPKYDRERIGRNNNIELHPCPYCSKAFTAQIFLQKHIKCHSTETLSQPPITKTQEVNSIFSTPPENETEDESILSLENGPWKYLLSEDKKSIQCFQCDESFSSSKDFDDHFTVHFNNTLFCKACDRHFGSEKTYRKHLILHFKPSHKCPHCSRTFLLRVCLLRHIRYVHFLKYTVEMKDELARLEGLLLTQVTASPVQFNCLVCSSSFTLYNDLLNHQKTCQTQQEKQSSYSVSSPEYFKGEKQKHKCNTCGTFYSSKKALMRHKRKSKLHKLCLNGKKFSHARPTTQNLSDIQPLSIATSEVEDRFNSPSEPNIPGQFAEYNNQTLYCIDCGLPFTDERLLNQHIHNRDCRKTNVEKCRNTLQCHFCPRVFDIKSDRFRHLMEHFTVNEDGMHPCAYCSKQFEEKDMLARHVKYHFSMVTCDMCNMKFPKFILLKKHVELKHNAGMSHVYSKVKKSSSNNLHKHPIKRWSCKTCGKMFIYPKRLSDHMESCVKKKPSVDTEENEFPQQESAMMNKIEPAESKGEQTSFDSQNIMKHIKTESSQESVLSPKEEVKTSDNLPSNCPGLRNRKAINYFPKEKQLDYVKKENKFQCPKCLKFFSNRYSLTRHKETAKHNNSTKRFKCQACKKSFHYYSLYYQHQRKYHHQQKSRCKNCHKTFSSVKLLSHHKCNNFPSDKIAADDHEHVCTTCGAKFQSSIGLSNHNRLHQRASKERSFEFTKHFEHEEKHKKNGQIDGDCPKKCFKCKRCMIVFENEQRLKVHLKSSTHFEGILKSKTNEPVEELFECKDCGKMYKSYPIVLRHRRNFYCKGIDGLECHICHKVFPDYKKLKEHFNSEHQDGYPCWHCSKVFVTISNVTRHLCINHSEEKKFHCFHCTKKFNNLEAFTTHVGKNVRHACKLCDSDYITCYRLSEHILANHT